MLFCSSEISVLGNTNIFKMVDAIAIAESIIGIGLYIHQTIEEVQAFKDLAERLMYRVKQITPALEVLQDMKGQRKKLADAQKSEPKLAIFAQSLKDMLIVIEEVKTFTETLKEMSTFDTFMKKGNIQKKFDDLEWKLGVLQGSIQLSVLTDVAREMKTKRTKKSFKILVKYVMKSNSGDLSSFKLASSMTTKGMMHYTFINFSVYFLQTLI